MTEKRFNRVGGYVYDKDKCISHFEDVKHRDEIIDLLNELHEENMILKQPHCRKCEYFSSDNADCYCMKKGFNSIDDFNIAKNCKDYTSVLE